MGGVSGQEVYRFPSPSWYVATQRTAEVDYHFSCGFNPFSYRNLDFIETRYPSLIKHKIAVRRICGEYARKSFQPQECWREYSA